MRITSLGIETRVSQHLEAATAVPLALFLAAPSTPCVAASITHLVSVKVIKGLVATVGMWTNVAVTWIEAVIDVAVEVARAVEPRSGSDEHATAEPLGPVVPVWRAVVWGHVVIAIRANRFCSDIDRDLSGCRARNAQHSGDQGGKGKEFPITHVFLLTLKKATEVPKLSGLRETHIQGKERANLEHTPK
jgi:hypothetical protein